jgi:hypothetical protein
LGRARPTHQTLRLGCFGYQVKNLGLERVLLQSYGKYTAWALGNVAELAHSVVAYSDEIRDADRKYRN